MKNFLDELRNKIIQNLIDHNVLHHGTMDEFIHEQINQTLEGYDLSNIERSYIYNLIENRKYIHLYIMHIFHLC